MISILTTLIIATNPHCPHPHQMAMHLVKLDRQVPGRIMEALIAVESEWHPKCRGAAGEVGLCQIHPVHRPAAGWTKQMNWAANHLAGLKRRYGSWETALAAYNGGPGNRTASRCRAYAARVMARANKEKGE